MPREVIKHKNSPTPEALKAALLLIAKAHQSRNTATDKLVLIGRALREVGILDAH